jgi:hypothetical protein
VPQLGHATALAGDDRHHGHAQGVGELAGINLMSVVLGHIDHVEGNYGSVAQLYDLGSVVEVALEVRSIDDN